MKKIDKANLIIILTGVSVICLIIGGYLAYSGIRARNNQEKLVQQLNEAYETNEGLQENQQLLKDLLSDKDDKPETKDSVDDSVAKLNYLDNIDPITLKHIDEIFPMGITHASSELLVATGVSVDKLRYAYELKLVSGEIDHQLEGEVSLDKVQLIDANTCAVVISSYFDELSLIYSIDSNIGINFTELKRTPLKKLDESFYGQNNQLGQNYIMISSQYDVYTGELLDSLVLNEHMIEYSPDGKYISMIAYEFQRRFLSYDYDEDNPDAYVHIIVKEVDSNRVLMDEYIEPTRNISTSWALDSSMFAIGGKVYYDLDDLKSYNIDEGDIDKNGFITSTITQDYILKVFLKELDDKLNEVTLAVYDKNFNYINDYLIFETEERIRPNYSDYYHIEKQYGNMLVLRNYKHELTESYRIEVDEDYANIDEISDEENMTRYKYIPELSMRMKDGFLEGGSRYMLTFEDLNGEELFSVETDTILLNGYLGVDTELKEMYFFSESDRIISNNDEDYQVPEQFIVTYNYETGSLIKQNIPLDHVLEAYRDKEVFHWVKNYYDGVFQLQTFIQLDDYLEVSN